MDHSKIPTDLFHLMHTCVSLLQGKKDGGVELNEQFFKGLTDFLQLYSERGNALEKKQLDLQRRLLALQQKLDANASNIRKLRDNRNSTSETK